MFSAVGSKPEERPRQAVPLGTADLQSLVTAIADDAHGWVAQIVARRDIASVVIGFSGALRREQRASLEIHFAPAGDQSRGEMESRPPVDITQVLRTRLARRGGPTQWAIRRIRMRMCTSGERSTSKPMW